MEYKHFVDPNGQVHALLSDGSQDHIQKDDWIPINDDEVDTHADAFGEAQYNLNNDWYRKRILNYPAMGDFIDAYIKGDTNAMEEYKQKCFEVKATYPKPEGF